MEIVIDIPEETYDFVQNTSFVEDERTLFKQTNAERQKTLFLFDIMDAIRNGTPLPEHHGRLIDADDLYENTEICHSDIDGYACVRWKDINDAPTIIEGSENE